jgi:hypothetical protein
MEEDWFLEITSASADGSNCSFTLRGSKTGIDGEGVSTNRFVSNSRRIVLEPGDWNLAYAIKVFKRPLPDKFVVTWRSVLHGLDTAAAPNSAPGMEASVTVADGLSPGPHTIELQSPRLSENVRFLRTYNPLAADRPTKPSSE